MNTFVLHLQLAVFSLSEKLSSFAFISKARISLTILIYVLIFHENINANLMAFAVNAILNLSNIFSLNLTLYLLFVRCLPEYSTCCNI